MTVCRFIHTDNIKNIDLILYIRRIKKIIFILILLVLAIQSKSQNCIASATNYLVCQGKSVTLKVTFDAGYTPINYSWNLGNGVTSTQSSPTYIYPKTGTFTPSVKVNFTGSKSCTVNAPDIKVVGNPHPNFKFTTPLTQCFKGNQVCITDLSFADTAGKGIRSHLILWDDGSFDSTSIYNQNFCHTYTSPFGGYYSVAVEVSDSNNCAVRLTKTDSVQILQKLQPISFTTQYTPNCIVTPVNFFNSSFIPKAQVKKFYWLFDDGSVDATQLNWSKVTHNYTQTGVFNPALVVENLDGCRDTFVLLNGAKNMALGKTLNISVNSKCVKTQDYVFTLPNSTGANYSWQFFNSNGKLLDTSSKSFYVLPIKLIECGLYRVHLHATLASCTTDIDTSFDLLGPIAHLSRDKIGPTYATQCHITDTVYYVNPNPDFSCYYKDAIKRIWDFGDPYAPACTLDTRHGLNIGMNCRYSKDSLRVKHWYNPAHEGCYYASLYLLDTVTMCENSDTLGISLMPPNAWPDTSKDHPRLGLQVIGKPCLNKTIKFDISQTLPMCNRTNAWVLPDSAAGKNWIMFDTGNYVQSYVYTKTKDTSGWVTIGLIIQNGNCFDTAWYHNRLQFIPLSAAFTLKNNSICPPYHLILTPKDSTQDSLVSANWTLNGGSIKQQLFLPGDTTIHQLNYTQQNMGLEVYGLTLVNTKGCVEASVIEVPFGFVSKLKLSKEVMCQNDTLVLQDDITYSGSIIRFWEMPIRAISGKETIKWVVGDTLKLNGTHPVFNAPHIGNYPIKMIAKDSIGCYDTLTYIHTIKSVGIKASVLPMDQIYVCAPKIVTFKSASYIIDSSALYNQTNYDAIKESDWNFGDKSPISTLPTAIHNYNTNDTFPVTLKVISQHGCKDSTALSIVFLGPNPSFRLISGDTNGCVPQDIVFKSFSKGTADNWIWNSVGPLSNTYSFSNDTTVIFNYILPGTYSISLTEEAVLKNPITGTNENCKVVYPDPNGIPFQFTLFEKPVSNLVAPDSVCSGKPFDLIASCNHNLLYFDFYIDNTHNQVTRNDSVLNYSLTQAGKHQVILIPVLNGAPSCNDSIHKTINVVGVKADFTESSIVGTQINLLNKSLDAQQLKWYFFDKNAGKKDSSTLENPSYLFKGGNDSVIVCLLAINSNGCTDSTCRSYSVLQKGINIPNVFTPDNDNYNDAFDIQISGNTKYNLEIFDRWGANVYESSKDGIGNDGINWNGKNQNTGAECSNGTYYYIFTYRFVDSKSDIVVNGTISLIR